ncbi:MAG: DNA alkylation repair protein [Candidatus Hodarchaeales archaeon]|jgi:3-methyladenine DNA glycosylase AlkD
MKIKLSKKDKERYSKENQKIFSIKDCLTASDFELASQLLENALEETEFKTKFGSPEKNLTKYIFCKLLEEPTTSIEKYDQFYQKLWEKEDGSLREIGLYILGFLFSQSPENYFQPTVELVKLCTSWNDIDNLVGYVIEEHVAKDYDFYLGELNPLINHENQWIKRLVIVSLGRGFFLTKKRENMRKCLETIEKSFTDARKIVLDANSWIIGTLGFRVDPEQVVNYFEKYRLTDDPTIIKLFCDVVKRSKLSKELPPDLKEKIISSLKQWGTNESKKTKKSVISALKFINS